MTTHDTSAPQPAAADMIEDEATFDDSPESYTATGADVAAFQILPVSIMLIAVVCGLVLNWIIPIPVGRAWGGIGFLLVMVSGAGIYWCKNQFDLADTSIIPTKPTRALVTEGPYQYSRNPIYLFFMLCYAGIAMLADAPIMFICLIPLWYALDKYIVQPEEMYLARKFGAAYAEYAASVGRWVGTRRG